MRLRAESLAVRVGGETLSDTRRWRHWALVTQSSRLSTSTAHAHAPVEQPHGDQSQESDQAFPSISALKIPRLLNSVRQLHMYTC
jgi:hypothetical protein